MSKGKVLVGLSGGVDSSVSAAFLQQQGYEVEGAFIRTWSAPWLPCTWRSERRDAMRVAAHLDIPFHTVDLADVYEREVVEYLVREYAAGRTPNPDVMCNKYVKFGVFFDRALERGYTHIATGHYARVGSDASGARILLAGKDRNKDQSYFLWTLTQAQLSRTLFPVGEMEKPQVRAQAAAFGLPTATKKDSQGVCFLGKVDMKEFLSHYIDTAPGDVLDTSGAVIGTHDGALFFTLGERHGFRIHHQGTNDAPRYVVAKDMEHNTITVAPHSSERAFLASEIVLTDVSWVSGTVPTGDNLSARVRYRQSLRAVANVTAASDGVHVVFADPQPYVPAGQSLVLYDGEVCLGGGSIDAIKE